MGALYPADTRWSGDSGWRSTAQTPPKPKGAVPSVLEAMLAGMMELYAELPDEGVFLPTDTTHSQSVDALGFMRSRWSRPTCFEMPSTTPR